MEDDDDDVKAHDFIAEDPSAGTAISPPQALSRSDLPAMKNIAQMMKQSAGNAMSCRPPANPLRPLR